MNCKVDVFLQVRLLETLQEKVFPSFMCPLKMETDYLNSVSPYCVIHMVHHCIYSLMRFLFEFVVVLMSVFEAMYSKEIAVDIEPTPMFLIVKKGNMRKDYIENYNSCHM